MQDISQELLKSLYSNNIPKADIKISIKKTEHIEGEYVETEVLSFFGKNVLSVDYSKEIDPTGGSLPFEKLKWEQIYLGETYEGGIPVGFDDVSVGMAVDFSVVYNFVQYLSWKSHYESGKTWKSFFDGLKSWRNIFYDNITEEIKVGRLFLSSLPTVKNNKISWEAKDVLSFVNVSVAESTGFMNQSSPVVRLSELVQKILNQQWFDEDGFSDYSLSSAINKSDFDRIFGGADLMYKNQVFVGRGKDIIKNSLSPLNWVVDFSTETGALIVRNSYVDFVGSEIEPKRNISLKNQSDLPKIKSGENILNYVFDSTNYFVDYENPFYAEPSLITFDGIISTHYYSFNEPSTRFDSDGNSDVAFAYNAVKDGTNNVVFYIKGEDKEPYPLKVYPVKSTKNTFKIRIGNNGKDFEEKNPLNPYDDISEIGEPTLRAEFLSAYYNNKNSDVDVSLFGDPSIQTGDFVSVQTNLLDRETMEKLVKNGVVVSNKISYNGSVKQKIVVHQIS